MTASALRARVALLLAAALAFALLPGAAPVSAGHYSNTEELSAVSNVGAAAAWSKATFDNAVEVLLGRDDVFPDSLASGSMQGSRPLLLTNQSTLSPEADAELNRLKPTVVNILGGNSAVSAAVEEDLKSKGYTVRRFSGPTRIETAIDVARRTAPSATTAIVAAAFAPQGADETRAFADSIAAGGWAADSGRPVLLTQTDSLSASTRGYLRSSEIRTVFIVGGTAAVSEAAAAEIAELGITVRRVAGPNRFDTAVRIAAERGYSDAAKAQRIVLTEGQAAHAWAAGFAAAAYSARHNAPVVLSNGVAIPPATDTWLRPPGGAAGTRLVCGPRMESAACDTAAEGMGHVEVSGELPVLQSAALGPLDDNVQEVAFRFSEPLTGTPAKARFHLYTFDAFQIEALTAQRDAGAPDTVIATFPAAEADRATTAAVAHDAIKSTGGFANPEGATGLRAYTHRNGITPKPDLVGGEVVEISGEETAEVKTWRVAFDFDAPAGGSVSHYRLVFNQRPNPTGQTGSSLYSVTGRSISTDGNRALVEFDVARRPTTPPEHWGSGDLARLYVSSFDGNVARARRLRSTDGPDLSRIVVDRANNRVRYHFGENVRVVSTATGDGFSIWDSEGNTLVGTGTPVRDPIDNRIVDVTFPSIQLRRVIVGGGAVAGMVSTVEGGGLLGIYNGHDSVVVEPEFAAGATNGPRLDSVTRTTSDTSASVRFRFAESVEQTSNAVFVVYDEDGARTVLTNCSTGTGPGGATADVVCAGGSGSGSSEVAQRAAIRESVRAGVQYAAVRPTGTGSSPLFRPFVNHQDSRTYATS